MGLGMLSMAGCAQNYLARYIVIQESHLLQDAERMCREKGASLAQLSGFMGGEQQAAMTRAAFEVVKGAHLDFVWIGAISDRPIPNSCSKLNEVMPFVLQVSQTTLLKGRMGQQVLLPGKLLSVAAGSTFPILCEYTTQNHQAYTFPISPSVNGNSPMGAPSGFLLEDHQPGVKPFKNQLQEEEQVVDVQALRVRAFLDDLTEGKRTYKSIIDDDEMDAWNGMLDISFGRRWRPPVHSGIDPWHGRVHLRESHGARTYPRYQKQPAKRKDTDRLVEVLDENDRRLHQGMPVWLALRITQPLTVPRTDEPEPIVTVKKRHI